ncbi:MAG TPA: SDR family oxidoreductase [Pyrinomonadaceae bacterium]
MVPQKKVIRSYGWEQSVPPAIAGGSARSIKNIRKSGDTTAKDNEASYPAHRPILIIGGTRGTGLLIAKLLEQRGSSVRVLARDPAAAKPRLGAGIQIAVGDITKAETLPGAIKDAKHIIFTAGCRSGRPAREARIKSTEYEGVLNAIAGAQAASFRGRFMYMTASGVDSQSWMARCLNLYKGNTLRWRRRAEEAIRESGLDYTIIRTGVLQNRGGGRRAIKITQQPLPLSVRYRIARADVAQVFVRAMEHPNASCATFEITWGDNAQSEPWSKLLETLKPDAALTLKTHMNNGKKRRIANSGLASHGSDLTGVKT